MQLWRVRDATLLWLALAFFAAVALWALYGVAGLLLGF